MDSCSVSIHLTCFFSTSLDNIYCCCCYVRPSVVKGLFNAEFNFIKLELAIALYICNNEDATCLNIIYKY